MPRRDDDGYVPSEAVNRAATMLRIWVAVAAVVIIATVLAIARAWVALLIGALLVGGTALLVGLVWFFAEGADKIAKRWLLRRVRRIKR